MTKVIIQFCRRTFSQTSFLWKRWFLNELNKLADVWIYSLYYLGFLALQQKYQLLDRLAVFCCSNLHILTCFGPHNYSQGIWLWHGSNNTWKNWKWHNLLNFMGNEIPAHNEKSSVIPLSIQWFSCILIGCICYQYGMVSSKIQLTNWMWFSVVCTLIDNDTSHHSGQNVVDSQGAAEWVHKKFWPLHTRWYYTQLPVVCWDLMST